MLRPNVPDMRLSLQSQPNDPSTRTPFQAITPDTASARSNAIDIESITQKLKAVEISPDAEVIDWEKERKEMDKMFDEQARDKFTDIPAIRMPKQFAKGVKLFAHQKEGIRWLVNQERSNNESPFVREATMKDGSIRYYCRLTKHRILNPEPLQGSILADEMGLGKTVQTLGLILANPPKNVSFPVSPSVQTKEPVATLIVCPKTVISNWDQQIKQHLKPGTLRTAVYSGTNRAGLLVALQNNKLDVVLATYETLTADLKKKDTTNKQTGMPHRTIFEVDFFRMALDEAHIVRNSSSKAFKAVMSIKTDKKVCLTGTPFVNNPGDIQSLLAIVNLQPLADARVFQETITEPIMEKSRVGLTRLRTSMSHVALRRTKGATDIELVDKEVVVRRVTFSEGPHKDIHDSLFLTAQAAFEASLHGDDGSATQQGLFEMLLRARQSCCHGGLVPKARHARATAAMEQLEMQGGRKLTASEGLAMLALLQAGKSEGRDADGIAEEADAELGPSPKVLSLLDAICDMKADEKGVIFSQWTKFLDIIQASLKEQGHQVVRIDGSMSTEERIEAMETYETDDEVRFILCSLKAAGTGINLVRGNHVFMMDPWFNDATENQAMDRVHRVGQVRSVHCTRFVMKDSIEERMLTFQQSKAALGKGSLERLSREEENLAKITTMKILFQIDSGDNADDLDDFIDDWKF